MDLINKFYYPFLLILRIPLLIQFPITLSEGASTTSDYDQRKDFVFPRRLSCLEVNEKLIQRNVKQINRDWVIATDLLDCSQINGGHQIYNNQHNNRLGDNSLLYEIDSRRFSPKPVFIQLKKDNAFLSPSFLVEERFGDLYTRGHVDTMSEGCFYTGHILGDNSSAVTVSACNGMQGVIRTSTAEWLITPSARYSESNAEHLLYTADVQNSRRSADHQPSSPCPISGQRNIRKIPHNYKFDYDGEGNLRLSLHRTRTRRALSVKRHIETMVVADETMFEYYGRKEVELRRYLLSIMAIVTTLMKDESIGNFVDVSVIKLIILKKNPHTLNITKNASKTLKSFCDWQKKQNKPDDSDPEHFDTAILVTRQNLCSDNNKCETLGLAELGSICDSVRSCSVVEDNGLSVAFTIAHELGHLLNAPHDGEQNTCNELNEQVHIMTPTFSIKYKTWTWSSCSRKYITEFIESSDAVCLLDRPSPKFDHPMPLKLPGELFSRKQQCQLVYGKNSTDCLIVDKCDRLWCECYQGGRKTCHTNNMPWADGTTCGENKWCFQGLCRQKEKLEPVHGSWGEWGPFSQCSRPCGGGVKFATRECNSPRPSYNGDYCIGRRHKYKSCRTQSCQNTTVSFRAQQCSAFNGQNFDILDAPKVVVWLPKYSGLSMEDSCKLFCEIKGSGIFYQLASKVIDGTKCRKGSNDICVDGKCRPAGCDNIMNSNSKVDQCGECNGDNSACRIFTGTKKETHMGYNSVVTVPRGASRLRVVQTSSKPKEHDTNFLALLNHKMRYIFNGQWRISLGRRRYLTYGTGIFYSGPKAENETIWVPAPLQSPVEVKVLSIGASDDVKIWYSYTFPVQSKQSYTWFLQSDWSECYPACNGHQIREYECQRDIDAQVVSSSKCHGTKPAARHRTCNFDCDLVWKTVKGQCSPEEICGHGVQDQTSVCTKVYRSGNRKNQALSSRECSKAKIGNEPPAQIPCHVQCASVYWVYTDWTKCNATCGGGYQRRSAQCVDQSNNITTLDYKCNSTEKGLLWRPCNAQQCPKWHTGAWSGSCSVTCGKGVVERPVFCMVDGQTVQEKDCSWGKKPVQTRPCKMATCASWATKYWSKCSQKCGAGHQTREVFCQTPSKTIVEGHRCNAAEKPTNSRKCFEKACELKAQLTQKSAGVDSDKILNVRWLAGVWGDCSRSCGHGYRERVIACVSNNAIVTENYCDPSQKPIKKELCNTYSCPFWRHGAWSKCTKVCGNGTQTRLVLCGFNGALVSNAQCEQISKPVDRRYCNQHRCPETVAHDAPPVARASTSFWRLSDWSPCSSTCGNGHRTRAVQCTNHAECEEEKKPESVISCYNGACPGWNYGQWTPCHTERGCGKGWHMRLVVCQMEDGRVLPNQGCDINFKPIANRTCELSPCQQDAKWSMTAWQSCNVPCGDGLQFRHVACKDIKSKDVPENRCLVYEQKPILQKSCSSSACPSWKVELWSECDSSCIQHRVVICVRGSDQLDPTLCKLQNKPTEEQDCSNENCVREPTYTWKTSAWSACGASCGYSLRSREVECHSNENRVVKDSFCTDKMPAMIEQCFNGPCPPEWTAEPWGECSTSCGEGIQNRSVFCKGLIGAKLPDTACEEEQTLATTRACTLGNCNDTSRWMVGAWLQCSRICGIGETKRDVRCVDRENKTLPDSACPVQTMPDLMKVCNTHNCPKESCRDMQRDFDIKFDGEHILKVGNGTLLVYCEGMHRNNPKEFVTLKSDPRENYSEIYGKRLRDGTTCPNSGRRQNQCLDCIDYTASGVTFFKRIRIDFKRMTIVPEDMTFADRFGNNPPGFASAGDCYSRVKCPQGRFMINLQGTGLRISDGVTWTSRGYHTSQKIRRHKNGQVIYGTCGGYCGMCSPTDRNGLKIDLMMTLR